MCTRVVVMKGGPDMDGKEARVTLRRGLLIAAGAIGSVLGDSFGFFIGHRWGRGLIERWSFTRRHFEPKLDSAEEYFERHGGLAVFVARWVGALRAVFGTFRPP